MVAERGLHRRPASPDPIKLGVGPNGGAPRIHQRETHGQSLHERIQKAVACRPFLLRAFLLADVTDYDTAQARTIFGSRVDSFQPRPEHPNAFPQHPQFARLRLAGAEATAVAKVNCMVFFEHETREPPPEQRAPGYAQQRACGEVGFQDQAFF
jgi:hypothetical protein